MQGLSPTSLLPQVEGVGCVFLLTRLPGVLAGVRKGLRRGLEANAGGGHPFNSEQFEGRARTNQLMATSRVHWAMWVTVKLVMLFVSTQD